MWHKEMKQIEKRHKDLEMLQEFVIFVGNKGFELCRIPSHILKK